jgi:hypothetical protein
MEYDSPVRGGEQMSSVAIAAAIIVAVGLAAFLAMLPDIRRYLKIRSM